MGRSFQAGEEVVVEVCSGYEGQASLVEVEGFSLQSRTSSKALECTQHFTFIKCYDLCLR